MGEMVGINSHESYDADGNLVSSPIGSMIEGIVSPLGKETVDDQFTIGDVTSVQVLFPPGTVVSVGDILTIRGLIFRVKYLPWDWSYGRRPWNSRHIPRVQVVAERGEA